MERAQIAGEVRPELKPFLNALGEMIADRLKQKRIPARVRRIMGPALDERAKMEANQIIREEDELQREGATRTSPGRTRRSARRKKTSTRKR